MQGPLRLTLVADIHHGRFAQTKAGPLALELLEAFVRTANEQQPDLVVDLGDRISDQHRATDLCLLGEVAARFLALRVPRVHLLGNHDQVNLSVADSEAVLGVALRSRTLDLQGWHLVFWYPDSRSGADGVYAMGGHDLAWLEADLAATDRPSIIFTHVPFDDGSMVGNYYFETSPRGAAGYENAVLAREIVQRSHKVVMVVAGHVHWNALNVIDGIPYVTIQSLTETFTTSPEPAGAWATLDASREGLHLQVYGRDRLTLSLPVKPLDHHWLSQDDTPTRAAGAGVPPVASVRSHAGRPLAGVRGVILDLDGVVYEGTVLLPGAREFLSFLRDTGRRVVALTNHSGGSSKDYAEKLRRLGVSIPEQDIVTSAMATAQYLRRRNQSARCLILGSAALKDELLSAGLVESSEAEYVVVGYDPALCLSGLAEATRCLLRGAELIGTNADAVLPTPEGPLPDCGPVLAFLEMASGRRATVVGKPNAFIVELAASRLGLCRDEILIVGDTVETDVAAGLAAGIRTALVLTGNGRKTPAGRLVPTLIVPDLEALRVRWTRES